MNKFKEGHMTNKVIIHGENVFIPVNKMPEGKTTKHKMYIAGHSETGHHHVLESKTDFEILEAKDNDELYIRLFAPANVVHKKSHEIHETKVLQPGVYKRTFATEYDPFTKVIRRIFD